MRKIIRLSEIDDPALRASAARAAVHEAADGELYLTAEGLERIEADLMLEYRFLEQLSRKCRNARQAYSGIFGDFYNEF